MIRWSRFGSRVLEAEGKTVNRHKKEEKEGDAGEESRSERRSKITQSYKPR